MSLDNVEKSEDAKDPGYLRRALVKEDHVELGEGVVINASGHVQELDRNFNFLSIASIGLVVGCTWPILGGSIVTALYNGGAPGVLYEL